MAPCTPPSRPIGFWWPSSSGPRCATARDIDAITRSASRTPSAAAIPHTLALLPRRGERTRENSGEACAEARVRERVLESATPCVSHTASHTVVGEQANQRTGDRLRILARHQQAGLAVDDHIARGIIARSETRNSRAHRLQVYEPEPFAATR